MSYNKPSSDKRRASYILVTGGAGYIGSHTTLCLLQNGYRVIVVDNLCNSYSESITRIRELSECDKDDLLFIKLSVNDKKALCKVFNKYQISSVIHFAGLKSVSESIRDPLTYYHNNVTATCTLLECMELYGCHKIVFSSSATVYGNATEAYIKENAAVNPLTPYGRSKLMCEEVIKDACKSAPVMCAAILRYFNPVGCHESGLLGENPRNAPNNLMPCVTDAMYKKSPMKLFGDDYSTPDKTAIRDFIHVEDLAAGHLAALKKLESIHVSFCKIFNMGNGIGSSVKEIINTMEKVTGVPVPYTISPRRDGDAECVVADPTKAFTELQWKPCRDLSTMCSSAWNWKSKNPDGYVISKNGKMLTIRVYLKKIVKKGAAADPIKPLQRREVYDVCREYSVRR